MKFTVSDKDVFLSLLGGRTDYNKILVDKTVRYKWLFNLLPGVREVAFCNSVSFDTADEASDIDLFFIIRNSRFFSYRFVITILFSIFGVRRHNDLVAGRFCLSFFISDDVLDLEKLLIQNDVYFYFWFYHLIFLNSDFDLQRSFLASNKSWFEEDNFTFKNMNLVDTYWFVRLFQKVFELSIFDFIEKFMKDIQLKRICKKNEKLKNPPGVYISEKILKFHVLDIRENISARFYRETQGSHPKISQ